MTGLARKSGGNALLGEVSDTQRTSVMTEWRNTGAKHHSTAPGNTTFKNAKRLFVEMFAEWLLRCNHLGWLHCTTVHTLLSLQKFGQAQSCRSRVCGPSHALPQHSYTVVSGMCACKNSLAKLQGPMCDFPMHVLSIKLLVSANSLSANHVAATQCI